MTMEEDAMPTWFITGCSTGLGRALAEEALARGLNVVVTARDQARVDDIAATRPDRALALPLDVTDPRQIAEAVRKAEERFGGVDALVNNAGYGYRAAVEEGEEGDVQRLFATNVFGLVAMTKAVLPAMRARHSGAIVNISSIAGRLAAPGSGYYAATKSAVISLTDALRKEVGPLGIKAIVVEPGAFRTDFAGRSLTQSARALADYADTAGKRRKENDKTDGTQPGDPIRAATAIIDAVEAAEPPFQLLLGSDAVRIVGAEVEAQLAEIRRWEEVSIGTDFRA